MKTTHEFIKDAIWRVIEPLLHYNTQFYSLCSVNLAFLGVSCAWGAKPVSDPSYTMGSLRRYLLWNIWGAEMDHMGSRADFKIWTGIGNGKLEMCGGKDGALFVSLRQRTDISNWTPNGGVNLFNFLPFEKSWGQSSYLSCAIDIYLFPHCCLEFTELYKSKYQTLTPAKWIVHLQNFSVMVLNPF